MPFSYPRNVVEYHAALRGEAKGLRGRARRLRITANHRQATREDLREVRLFVAAVMDEMADLAEKRIFDAEVNGGPVVPEWDAEGRPVTKRARKR